MKRTILILCVLIAMVTAFSLPVYSAEIYIWIDEKGGKHITDQPPEKPVEIIGKESYKPNSPEEIRRYQEEHKRSQRQSEARLEGQRRYNQEKEASEKRFEAYKNQHTEEVKLQIIERKEAATERIDDLNAKKERLRAIENRDYHELRRLRLKDERQKIDRDINKYKEIKDQ